MVLPLFRIFMLKNSCVIAPFGNDLFQRTCILKRTLASGKITCGSGCDGSQRKVQMDPACKVAFVTGGNTGIGFAMASQLLKAGARNVVIVGRDTCKGRDAVHRLNSAFGKNKAMYIGANLTCMVQFEEAFKTAKDTYKHIDIVVNCAGELDGRNWEKEIVTNIVGTIRGNLLAFRYMGKEGSGRGGVVVNVSGINGIEGFPAAPTFCSTQHAIVGLSKSLGTPLHHERSGIRVVHLLTGFTQTDFIKGLEKKGMTPQLGHELSQVVTKAKKQSPGACGQALIHLIKCGGNGSLWLIEGSRLFELNQPHWDSYKTLTAQYI